MNFASCILGKRAFRERREGGFSIGGNYGKYQQLKKQNLEYIYHPKGNLGERGHCLEKTAPTLTRKRRKSKVTVWSLKKKRKELTSKLLFRGGALWRQERGGRPGTKGRRSERDH